MGYTYVASDLHGCYGKYKELLTKIEFKDEDRLFILGDVADRGPLPISIIKDIMSRDNVEMTMGNHELFTLRVLLHDEVESPIDEITEDFFDETTKQHYFTWMFNGGRTTFEEFFPLSKEERKGILDFLQNLPSYIEIEVNGKKFFLVHAGIESYRSDEESDRATVENFVWYSPTNFDNPFFDDPDRYLVFGHTPTSRLEGGKEGEILIKNNYIAVDCGCVFGGRLGCLRLDDMKEFYV